VDFFPASRAAAKYAIALASRFKAGLVLLHVIEPVAPWIDEVPLETREMRTTARAKSVEELNTLANLADASNVRAQVVVQNGFVDTIIEAAVRAHSVDLVVMGTHGRRQLGRFFLGSTTERLLRKLPVPVLVTRDGASAQQSVKRILVTTDLSEGTQQAIAYAFSLAKVYGANTTLLHVLNDLQADLSGGYREQLIAGIKSELENLLPGAPSNVCTVRVVTGRPVRRILPIVKKEKIDLIVMNLHQKTIMDRLTIGSTAEKIIRAATIPVLAVPSTVAIKPKARLSGKAA